MKNVLIFPKNKKGPSLIFSLVMVFQLLGCSKDDDTVEVVNEVVNEISSENLITSFVFLLTENPIAVNVIGTVDNENRTITVLVPEGTDVTALLPEISISANAEISTVLVQNFTNPVEYVITAQDGTTATYTATVTVALSQRDVLQAILDANPNNTLNWNLQTTENLEDLGGVTTNSQGQITELRMNAKNISSLPSEIGQLTKLVFLACIGNLISTLPVELFDLIHLENLFLNINQIASIPEEIGQLVNLINLGIENNQLQTLSQEIEALTRLEYLLLAGNLITEMPLSLCELPELVFLDLNNNQITALPQEIGNVPKLTFLNLQNNQLTEIPESIGNLTSLQDLYLFNNQLTSLPSEIGLISTLQLLEIRSNNIIELPQAICNLEIFSFLDIFLDPGVNCVTQSNKDVIIGIYSANRGNTLDWGVDNYPGVVFNGNGTPIQITMNNKNLVRIPNNIFQLGNLEILDINSNNLESLPGNLSEISTLNVITAASNNLTTVPDSFGLLNNLALLSLTSNPISSIPQEVCDLQISNGGILTLLTDPGEGCL